MNNKEERLQKLLQPFHAYWSNIPQDIFIEICHNVFEEYPQHRLDDETLAQVYAEILRMQSGTVNDEAVLFVLCDMILNEDISTQNNSEQHTEQDDAVQKGIKQCASIIEYDDEEQQEEIGRQQNEWQRRDYSQQKSAKLARQIALLREELQKMPAENMAVEKLPVICYHLGIEELYQQELQAWSDRQKKSNDDVAQPSKLKYQELMAFLQKLQQMLEDLARLPITDSHISAYLKEECRLRDDIDVFAGSADTYVMEMGQDVLERLKCSVEYSLLKALRAAERVEKIAHDQSFQIQKYEEDGVLLVREVKQLQKAFAVILQRAAKEAERYADELLRLQSDNALLQQSVRNYEHTVRAHVSELQRATRETDELFLECQKVRKIADARQTNIEQLAKKVVELESNEVQLMYLTTQLQEKQESLEKLSQVCKQLEYKNELFVETQLSAERSGIIYSNGAYADQYSTQNFQTEDDDLAGFRPRQAVSLYGQKSRSNELPREVRVQIGPNAMILRTEKDVQLLAHNYNLMEKQVQQIKGEYVERENKYAECLATKENEIFLLQKRLEELQQQQQLMSGTTQNTRNSTAGSGENLLAQSLLRVQGLESSYNDNGHSTAQPLTGEINRNGRFLSQKQRKQTLDQIDNLRPEQDYKKSFLFSSSVVQNEKDAPENSVKELVFGFQSNLLQTKERKNKYQQKEDQTNPQKHLVLDFQEEFNDDEGSDGDVQFLECENVSIEGFRNASRHNQRHDQKQQQHYNTPKKHNRTDDQRTVGHNIDLARKQLMLPANNTVNNNIAVQDFDQNHDQSTQNESVRRRQKIREEKSIREIIQKSKKKRVPQIDHDYLNVRANNFVIKQLQKQQIVHHIRRVFSDHVFFVKRDGKRQKGVLLASEQSLILANKDFKIIKVIPFKQINKVTFCESSAQLFLVQTQEYTALIECFKRQELNLFLLEMYKQNRLPYYSIEFASQEAIQRLSQFDILLKNEFYEAYQDARLAGYLEMYRPNFLKKLVFVDQWQELFVVLCEMGLLCFQKPAESRCYFIPTRSAAIKDFEMSANKSYPIVITFEQAAAKQQYTGSNPNNLELQNSVTSKSKFVFSAKSKADQQLWIGEIQKVIDLSLSRDILQLNEEITSYSKAEKQSTIIAEDKASVVLIGDSRKSSKPGHSRTHSHQQQSMKFLGQSEIGAI